MKKEYIVCCAILCIGALWSVRAELDDTSDASDSSQVRTSAQGRGSQLITVFQLCQRWSDDRILEKLNKNGLTKKSYPEAVLKTVMNMYNRSHNPQYDYRKFLKRFYLKQKRSVTTS